MALSLLTLMLGSALTTKPRATKRDATAMIRSLGFGVNRNAEPQPVDSAAVKLIKRGPEYSILKNRFSGVSDAIDEALVTICECFVLVPFFFYLNFLILILIFLVFFSGNIVLIVSKTFFCRLFLWIGDQGWKANHLIRLYSKYCTLPQCAILPWSATLVVSKLWVPTACFHHKSLHHTVVRFI